MNIMYKIINTLFTLLLILPVMGQTSDLNNSFRITANREDGRFSSSRGAVQYMLKQKPAFTFNPAFTATEFKKWQLGLCSTMKELIRFPEVKDQPAPVRIKMVQRLSGGEMGVLSVARKCCSLSGIDT